MASFSSTGSESAIRYLAQANLFNPDTAAALLSAGADAFAQTTAAEMQRTKYRLGRIAQKLHVKGKPYRRDRLDRPYLTVTINGNNKRGERNATVAFVLNYGRRKEYGEIAPAHFWERAKMKTAEALPQVYADVAEQIYQERGLS